MAPNSSEPAACPICRSARVGVYCAKDDARYYACRDCRVLFQYPQPARADMIDYADTEYADGGLYQEYVDARDMKLAHFRARLSLLRPHLRPGKLLDVGCACGYFLEVAQAEGFEVHGLEFSKNAIAAARPEVRSSIRQASLDSLDASHDGQYDVISAFDIIEHVDKPLAFVERAWQLLRPGGHLVISTPDADHWLRPVMRSRWPMLQPMQHLTLFSHRSLQLALEGVSFTNVTLDTAYKVISYGYLVDQLRTLNPLLFRVLGATTRVVPAGFLNQYRQINIGEVLALARKPS